MSQRLRQKGTTYVGKKRTRVAVDRGRRKQGQKAVERMREWHRKATTKSPYGIAWLGHCAHSVAAAHGRSASGWNAVDGWFRTPAKYRHSGKNAKNAPRGALQFWSGGSQGYGHVTVANGRGKSWGVDLPVSGKIGMVPTGEIAARWGLRYLGWIWADEVAGW
jgi:hypothetical protein